MCGKCAHTATSAVLDNRPRKLHGIFIQQNLIRSRHPNAQEAFYHHRYIMKILDLINKYNIEVVKQGNLYVAFCPFHRDENRPNFTIYPTTDSYFCYTCSIGGDAISFISRIENISREEASLRLYSDLSYLLEKLNKTPEPLPYNDTVALQVSHLFRRALYARPEKLEEIKIVMQDVDRKLVKSLTHEDAINLVADVNKKLNAV